MATQLDNRVQTVASELGLTIDELMQRGLHCLVAEELRAINAEMLEIRGRYGDADAEEIETQIREGSLDEEAGTWLDCQRLDHLQDRHHRLQALLRSL